MAMTDETLDFLDERDSNGIGVCEVTNLRNDEGQPMLVIEDCDDVDELQGLHDRWAQSNSPVHTHHDQRAERGVEFWGRVACFRDRYGCLA